jgi:hypothetical protein
MLHGWGGLTLRSQRLHLLVTWAAFAAGALLFSTIAWQAFGWFASLERVLLFSALWSVAMTAWWDWRSRRGPV